MSLEVIPLLLLVLMGMQYQVSNSNEVVQLMKEVCGSFGLG